MKFELEDNDVVIRRVTNGWIVKTVLAGDSITDSGFEFEEGPRILTHVYEEEDIPQDRDHSAFVRLLSDHFSECFRSKYSGGIVMRIEPQGWDVRERE